MMRKLSGPNGGGGAIPDVELDVVGLPGGVGAVGLPHRQRVTRWERDRRRLRDRRWLPAGADDRDAIANASDDLTVFAGVVHAPDGSGMKLAAKSCISRCALG